MFRKSLEKLVCLSTRVDYITTHCSGQDLPVTLTALINDTTGTLIASHYVRPKTRIAVIFGTGCNAAYMENVSAIEKIHDLGIEPSAQMAINCEWVRALCRVLMVVH